MKKNFISQFVVASFFLLAASVLNNSYASAGETFPAETIYSEIDKKNQADMPSPDVFALAYRGYSTIKNGESNLKKEIMTVIDFSLPSTKKRLWIIDLENKKVLFNDYVAHGKNSGDDVAVSFSNTSGSNMSSIGFYLTGETYQGKHGLSLRLEGLDQEYNSNARNRAIVMHGAEYVSADFIKKYGRLGRSLGCPSVSMDIHEQVINTIKDGSALFIYYPDPEFIERSQLLNANAVQQV